MIGLMVLRPGLPGVALAACVMFASPVFAETVSFKADLKASEEVPPNDSKATGTVTATYDSASKKLTWKGNYSGLTGPATMAHFHGPAEPGKNAGVAVPITPSTTPGKPERKTIGPIIESSLVFPKRSRPSTFSLLQDASPSRADRSRFGCAPRKPWRKMPAHRP